MTWAKQALMPRAWALPCGQQHTGARELGLSLLNWVPLEGGTVSARDLWKAPSMTQGGKGRDERLCWRLSAHVCVGVASLT